jgi:hypothetical protein
MPAMLIGPPALRQSLSHSYTHKNLLDPLLPRMTSGVLFYTTQVTPLTSRKITILLHCTLHFYSIAKKGVHALAIVPNYNFSFYLES